MNLKQLIVNFKKSIMRYLLIPIRVDISSFFQFLKNMSIYIEGERKEGREREYDV